MIRFAEGYALDDSLRGVSASNDGIVESLIRQLVRKATEHLAKHRESWCWHHAPSPEPHIPNPVASQPLRAP